MSLTICFRRSCSQPASQPAHYSGERPHPQVHKCYISMTRSIQALVSCQWIVPYVYYTTIKTYERSSVAMEPHPILSYSTLRSNRRRICPKRQWLGPSGHNASHNTSQPRSPLIICFNTRWDRIRVQKGVRKPFEQKNKRKRPRKTYIPL